MASHATHNVFHGPNIPMTTDKFGFEASMVHEKDQIKIRSACRKCGEGKIVSVHDGSLYRWQESHTCSDQGKSSDHGLVSIAMEPDRASGE